MSLGEAVWRPVDKYVIASALILFFAAPHGAPAGPFRHRGVKCLEITMIAGVLFIAAAVGKFVTGLDTLQNVICGVPAGSGMTPMGGKGLISTQMGLF